jgi:hypothetical protein
MSGNRLAAFVASLILSPALVHAHERWFVREGRHAGEHVSMEPLDLVLVLGGIVFVAVAFLVHHRDVAGRVRAGIDRVRRRVPDGVEWRVVAAVSGVMLLWNALSGVFLAPEFMLPGRGLALLGAVAQAVIAGLLLFRSCFLLAGAAILFVAVPFGTAWFRLDFLIHYGLEYIALALALILVALSSEHADPLAHRVRRWVKREPHDVAHLPLPVIRIGLGLTFMALALHCKFVDPNISLTFLDHHDLNFMRQLGVSTFTNARFLFAACVAETALGLTLALGIATTFVASLLLVVLCTTLAMFGLVELMGHLPIMAIVLLLLYRDAGSYGVPRTLPWRETRKLDNAWEPTLP